MHYAVSKASIDWQDISLLIVKLANIMKYYKNC